MLLAFPRLSNGRPYTTFAAVIDHTPVDRAGRHRLPHRPFQSRARAPDVVVDNRDDVRRCRREINAPLRFVLTGTSRCGTPMHRLGELAWHWFLRARSRLSGLIHETVR